MSLTVARLLAIAGGMALPLVETARRWRQLGDPSMWPFWLDDWVIGLFLLYGAWRTRAGAAGGRAVLAAAWGFACGLGYASFFSDLAEASADPSGFSDNVVEAAKGVMLLIGIAALVASLRKE